MFFLSHWSKLWITQSKAWNWKFINLREMKSMIKFSHLRKFTLTNCRFSVRIRQWRDILERTNWAGLLSPLNFAHFGSRERVIPDSLEQNCIRNWVAFTPQSKSLVRVVFWFDLPKMLSFQINFRTNRKSTRVIGGIWVQFLGCLVYSLCEFSLICFLYLVFEFVSWLNRLQVVMLSSVFRQQTEPPISTSDFMCAVSSFNLQTRFSTKLSFSLKPRTRFWSRNQTKKWALLRNSIEFNSSASDWSEQSEIGRRLAADTTLFSLFECGFMVGFKFQFNLWNIHHYGRKAVTDWAKFHRKAWNVTPSDDVDAVLILAFDFSSICSKIPQRNCSFEKIENKFKALRGWLRSLYCDSLFFQNYVSFRIWKFHNFSLNTCCITEAALAWDIVNLVTKPMRRFFGSHNSQIYISFRISISTIPVRMLLQFSFGCPNQIVNF